MNGALLVGAAFAASAGVAPEQEAAPAGPPPALVAARARYDRLDDEGALLLLQPLLATEPVPRAVPEIAARCLYQLQRFDAAIALLQAQPTPVAAERILLAECLAAKGEPPRALELLAAMIQEDPRQLGARVARIRVLILQDDLDGAAAAIADVRRIRRDLGDLIPLSAALAERGNQFPEALRLYEIVVNSRFKSSALDPHAISDAMEGLARVNFKLRRFEQSIRWYQELVNRHPKRVRYRFELGMSQGMTNHFDTAIATLREAVALDPGYHECRMRLAELYRTASAVEDAIREFELLRGVPPYHLDATRYLAELSLKTGAVDQALAYVKEIEGTDPPSPSVLETCGLVREQSGDLTGAKSALRRSFQLDPLRFGVLYRLALLLTRSDTEMERAEGALLMKRYQAAVPVMSDLDAAIAAIQLMPNNPGQMVHLAGVLNVAGQYDPALQWITRALRLIPDDALAHGIAGCIAANMGKNDESLHQFERAQTLLGQDRRDPKIDGYVDLLRKGQPLPLPLGEIHYLKSTDGSGGSGDR